ncbi:uncharacterized protein LTR77_002774 [Saxophila tyrrhenica]|uniref:Uncharacterized protein n=1 Tax=Saxophila tyrrhenica TaxID=1690608 RepID=A0AAV9PIC2_9PEZI|nr:hypothetical protein LTR77_002774 [Saxophila tyrrhenica]
MNTNMTMNPTAPAPDPAGDLIAAATRHNMQLKPYDDTTAAGRSAWTRRIKDTADTIAKRHNDPVSFCTNASKTLSTHKFEPGQRGSGPENTRYILDILRLQDGIWAAIEAERVVNKKRAKLPARFVTAAKSIELGTKPNDLKTYLSDLKKFIYKYYNGATTTTRKRKAAGEDDKPAKKSKASGEKAPLVKRGKASGFTLSNGSTTAHQQLNPYGNDGDDEGATEGVDDLFGNSFQERHPSPASEEEGTPAPRHEDGSFALDDGQVTPPRRRLPFPEQPRARGGKQGKKIKQELDDQGRPKLGGAELALLTFQLRQNDAYEKMEYDARMIELCKQYDMHNFPKIMTEVILTAEEVATRKADLGARKKREAAQAEVERKRQAVADAETRKKDRDLIESLQNEFAAKNDASRTPVDSIQNETAAKNDASTTPVDSIQNEIAAKNDASMTLADSYELDGDHFHAMHERLFEKMRNEFPRGNAGTTLRAQGETGDGPQQAQRKDENETFASRQEMQQSQSADGAEKQALVTANAAATTADGQAMTEKGEIGSGEATEGKKIGARENDEQTAEDEANTTKM